MSVILGGGVDITMLYLCAFTTRTYVYMRDAQDDDYSDIQYRIVVAKSHDEALRMLKKAVEIDDPYGITITVDTCAVSDAIWE